MYSYQPQCPEGVHPIDYAIFDEWLLPTIPWHERPISVLCTLRNSTMKASPYGGGRHRVFTWLSELKRQWQDPRMHIRPATGTGAGGCFDRQYFALMHKAKIIVTCQPQNWEGDWRTWESLSTGAMVMVDEFRTQMNPPLQPGVHYVQYNSSNRTDLEVKLEYYLQHPNDAAVIANAGFQFAVHRHRAVHRVDNMLADALQVKQQRLNASNEPNKFRSPKRGGPST